VREGIEPSLLAYETKCPPWTNARLLRRYELPWLIDVNDEPVKLKKWLVWNSVVTPHIAIRAVKVLSVPLNDHWFIKEVAPIYVSISMRTVFECFNHRFDLLCGTRESNPSVSWL
jgi:hypothetical protein